MIVVHRHSFEIKMCVIAERHKRNAHSITSCNTCSLCSAIERMKHLKLNLTEKKLTLTGVQLINK